METITGILEHHIVKSDFPTDFDSEGTRGLSGMQESVLEAHKGVPPCLLYLHSAWLVM